MRLTEQDVLCNVPPLFHCFDEFISKLRLFCSSAHVSKYLRLILGNLAAFTHASCVVYPSEIFDPIKIVDALLTEK